MFYDSFTPGYGMISRPTAGVELVKWTPTDGSRSFFFAKLYTTLFCCVEYTSYFAWETAEKVNVR